ncbi:hypothetical protein M918_17180 [Clostridium sp. BL8]|nr:hypothetical protein M918_17180 [Clostridium sp. BL8]
MKDRFKLITIYIFMYLISIVGSLFFDVKETYHTNESAVVVVIISLLTFIILSKAWRIERIAIINFLIVILIFCLPIIIDIEYITSFFYQSTPNPTIFPEIIITVDSILFIPFVMMLDIMHNQLHITNSFVIRGLYLAILLGLIYIKFTISFLENKSRN